MSTITSERYADWKAPRADGEVLVWPEGAELVRSTTVNAGNFRSSRGAVAGESLADLRREMRQWIGHDDALPLVATGHQTELYHPGVWVKNVLINRVAERVGGAAYLFAVDTDEPKHLNLRWPGESLGITDDARVTSAAWSGLLDPPTPTHVDQLEAKLESAAGGWSFTPVAFEFLRNARRLLLNADALPNVLVNALHEVDWSLGLRHHAMTVSPMFFARPYLVFVQHLMSRAAEFAGNYNAALAAYRIEQGIKTVGRPMPDLRADADHVESPFWIDELSTGTRQRAVLEKMAGGFGLRNGDDVFVFDVSATPEKLLAWLRARNVRISPRALTLTMFLRLFLADQFVHGIGGGRYDQVTDRLIQTEFAVDPPGFAVTTGTLLFPTAVGQMRVCMPCLLQEGHRIRHGGLRSQKGGWVGTIAGLPRRSMERRAAYREMHERLKEAGGTAVARFEAKLAEGRERVMEEEVLFDRELPYIIQSADRLAELKDRIEQGV